MQKPAVNLMVKAARLGGNVILRHMSKLDTLNIVEKSRQDYASEVDSLAEKEIIRELKRATPDYAFLAEESGQQGKSRYTWVIDPLDGTSNYLRGLPHFCVSIALLEDKEPIHGVVFDPLRNELFTASKGRGAFLNDRRIRVSKRIRLNESLIGTGFPFRQFDHVDAYLAMFRELTQKTAGIRRPGSAALDLAWLACGRIDGFWEMGLSPWDMAAGVLLIQEAGGLVSDLAGESDYMTTGNVVAGTPKIFTQLLPIIQAWRPATLQA